MKHDLYVFQVLVLATQEVEKKIGVSFNENSIKWILSSEWH